MIVSVPERGLTTLAPEAWAALSRDHRFWRLVENGIVQVESGGSGKWRLRGACYVGRAVIGPVVLQVVEKFPNALETLVGLGVLRGPKLVDTPSPVASSPGSAAILISLFIRAARTYLSRFKRIAYTRVADRGGILGGRLDVVRTARLRARGIFHQVAFDRNLLTANLPLNWCIYAALREVERLSDAVAIAPADVAAARALRIGLSECLPSVLMLQRRDLADIAAREAETKQTHAEIVEVASLAGAVLDAAGFGGLENLRRTIERSWFVNLEKLFEQAIRHVLSTAVNGRAEVTGPQQRPPLFYPSSGRYRANPDVVVRGTHKALAIGDAKYKDFSDWPSSSDVHEIIAHAAAYNVSKALLFYPSESDFVARSFGRAATGCELWAFGIALQDFANCVRRALVTAELLPTPDPKNPLCAPQPSSAG